MKLVTAQEMKEIDKLATEKYGVPSILLMDAAAKVVADEVASILGECLVAKSDDNENTMRKLFPIGMGVGNIVLMGIGTLLKKMIILVTHVRMDGASLRQQSCPD